MQKFLKTALRFLLKFLVAAAAWFGAVLALTIMGSVTQITSIGWFAALVYVLSVVILPVIVAIIAFHRSFRKDFRIPSVKKSTYVEPVTCTVPPPAPAVPPEIQTRFDNALALEALRQRRSPLFPPAQPTPDIRDSYAMYGGTNAEMLTIDLMDGHDFEFWCANALRDIGFEDVEVTPGSGDQGVDILAAKDGLRYAIQCKRYTSDLGNAPVQEVHAGKYFYRCHVAAVISNRYFTPGAVELASATGVLLWDRDWIFHYLQTKQNPDGAVLISHAPSAPPPIVAELDIDEMLPAAIDVILETGQASVSMLQRRLNLGYARCARLINEMEELILVGPFNGSSPRVIYITNEQWEAIKSTGTDNSFGSYPADFGPVPEWID